MPTLRLTQTALGDDRYQAMISLDNATLTTAQFSFSFSAQDSEDLRWYLEDYLEYPLDPAPKIAARVEARIREIGVQLFRDMFESSETARRLWSRVEPQLNDTRVEIVTGIRQGTAIPWELLRDPLTDVPLALRAKSFVRAQPDPATFIPNPPSPGNGKIRILLVICRPGGRKDVPFRSVASRIVRTLSDEARELVQLDVLRPPTFEQLATTLREAQRAGLPYHVVHFDGHGVYAEIEQDEDALTRILKGIRVITLGAPRSGKHGYLLFENPKIASNMTLVDGASLGKLLVETKTEVLVLNACQSAYAEAVETPRVVEDNADGENKGTEGTTQDQVRAFGSFAQEVMDAGVAGVVAMRYVLYVETAKRFVADLYSALLDGDSLGEAVTFGRKQLASDPSREIAYRPLDLQDWQVPAVYERREIRMLPRGFVSAIHVGAIHELPLRITLDAPEKSIAGVPPPPDVGFFGRDETLLALDRAFDSQSIVLLHAYAGSGKTTTAAEFARWYVETGGVRGAVLFTSFGQHKPLPRVLDAFGAMFDPVLERSGIQWLALSDEQRRGVALQVMEKIPILWIWDNVEPIAGFPTGTTSAWSPDEQTELKEFLSAARPTRAKFLLTSRRDEHAWLGELPRRITLPPMPMQERWQLARALAQKYGRAAEQMENWKPLLEFTRGNPMTVTVLVGQALRDGLMTKPQIENFVGKLRAGEAAFTDDEREGRSKSLGASLAFGFDTAFNADEQKILALLHFFQGFVDVDALRQMGNPKAEYCLPEVRGMTREEGIGLLDRAAEIGLLTALGDGYYSIHPALPWYFKNLFEEHYRQQSIDYGNQTHSPQSASLIPHHSPSRAFVEAMGALGNYYHDEYERGNRDVIDVLEAEEPNLLHARELARGNSWWDAVTSAMQGLRSLYDHTGRLAEWARLVNEIVPDFVDPATDGPLAGREDEWGLVTDYRVRLAREARQWAEAERLQRKLVEWGHQRAASVLALDSDTLDEDQKNMIWTIGATLQQLGQILREQGNPECVLHYEEASQYYQRVRNRPGEAVAAFNLGHAFKNLPAIRDLAKAEKWYKRALELRDEQDQLGRGKSYNQLGLVAFERFKDAKQANAPDQELLQHLNAAVQYYLQGLDLFPPNALDALAVAHNQLGIIYNDAGDFDRALTHYRESIRYEELQGNLYGAAQTRMNVAIALAQSGRFADALDYAQAALRNYETFGERAGAEIERTKEVIKVIEEAMRKEG